MDFAPTKKSEKYYRNEVSKIQRKVDALGLTRRDRQIALEKELAIKWPGTDFGIKIPPEKAAEIKKKIESTTTVHDLVYHKSQAALAQERVAHLSGEERRVKLEEILSGMYGTKIAVPAYEKPKHEEPKKEPETKKTEAKKTEVKKDRVKELKEYKDEIGDVQNEVAHLVEPERSKKLGELLEKKYGFDFGLYEKKADAVIEEVKKVEPEKQEEKLEEILEQKAPKAEKSKIKEMIRKIMPKAGIAFAIGAPMILAAFLLLNKAGNNESTTEKEKIDNKDNKNKKTPPTIGVPDSIKFTPSPEPIGPEPLFPEKKFDYSTFESLPFAGQEIYKYFYEHDPTPGSGYAFLDKQSGNLFVFDAENNLVTTFGVGFGKTPGDQTNNAETKGFKAGAPGYSGTTPAGGYWFNVDISPENLKEYEGLGINLDGITIEGEVEQSLGMHQIPHDEVAKTEQAIADPSIPNTVSNGCIRVPKDLFIKHIKQFLDGGNFSQIFFVLPDEHAKSGFDMNVLMNSLLPKAIEYMEKDYADLKQSIEENKATNHKKIEQEEQNIKDLEARGAPEAEIQTAKENLERDRGVLENEQKELKILESRILAARRNLGGIV